MEAHQTSNLGVLGSSPSKSVIHFFSNPEIIKYYFVSSDSQIKNHKKGFNKGVKLRKELIKNIYSYEKKGKKISNIFKYRKFSALILI